MNEFEWNVNQLNKLEIVIVNWLELKVDQLKCKLNQYELNPSKFQANLNHFEMKRTLNRSEFNVNQLKCKRNWFEWNELTDEFTRAGWRWWCWSWGGWHRGCCAIYLDPTLCRKKRIRFQCPHRGCRAACRTVSVRNHVTGSSPTSYHDVDG